MNWRRIGSLIGSFQSISAIAYGETRTAIGAWWNPASASGRWVAQSSHGWLVAAAATRAQISEVVSSNQYGGVTTESAFKVSENLLTAHKAPDGGLTVQGIFCPNESTAFGMLRALEDDGFAGKVHFVGFDSSPKMTDAMAKGHMDATVVQDPIRMGYLAVKAMADHLAGRLVDKRIDTGATLITRATMGTPEAQALLNPDFKKWLKE